MTKTLDSAAEAEREADRLRRDLTGTLDQILDNMTPKRLANEAYQATRSRAPDWLGDYWAFARSPAGLGLIAAAATSLVLGMSARRRRR